MADDIKKIFKNETIGAPHGPIVLNNKIKGVFGEADSVIQLTGITLQHSDVTTLFHTYGQFDSAISKGFEQPLAEQYRLFKTGMFNIYGWGTFNLDNQFINEYNPNFTYTFKMPIHNVSISCIFYSKLISYGHTQNGAFAMYDRVKNAITSVLNYQYSLNPGIQTEDANGIYREFSQPVGRNPFGDVIDWPNAGKIVSNDIVAPQNVSANVPFQADITKFGVTVRPQNLIQNILPILGYRYTAYRSRTPTISPVHAVEIQDYVPDKLVITITGDTIDTVETTHQIGTPENALELSKNSLVTTKSSINGTPLYQYRANKIIEEWHDGKQTISLARVVNNPDELLNIGDKVVVINARESDYTDPKIQTIARRPDGLAKVFRVDNTEFVYDGRYKQYLDLSDTGEGFDEEVQ